MKRYIAILVQFCCLVTASQNQAGSYIAKIPFRLVNNHIYIHLQINDSKPLWFLLDTGSGSIVDLQQAEALNLRLYDTHTTQGIGNAAQQLSMTDNIVFRLENISYAEEETAVMALDAIEECAGKLLVDSAGNIFAREEPVKNGPGYQAIDGVLGSGFFKKYVVAIDYRQGYLTLYDPANYQYDGKGTIVPLEISRGHIFAHASIGLTGGKTIKGRFMIDTGSMTAVIFTAPFVKKFDLLSSSAPTSPFSLCGIGGSSGAQTGMLHQLLIQDIGMDSLPAIFSQAIGGVLASTEFDGNIGNAVLRHFNVIFDYRNKRMILE